MRRINNLPLIISTLLLFSIPTKSEAQNDRIYDLKKFETPYKLLPDSSIACQFESSKTEIPVKRTLRVVGGVDQKGKFKDRGETLFRASEYLIDDYLNPSIKNSNEYSLFFEGKNYNFEQEAYFRISGEELKSGMAKFEITTKRENLDAKNGFFGVRIELYKKQKGKHPDEIYHKPDQIIEIPFPEGSSDLAVISESFKIPGDIANLLISVGGTGYKGQCWVESPTVSVGDKIVKIPFVPHEERKSQKNYWVGVNLSSRAWPLWNLSIDGKTIFEDRIFDRASNIADFYIPLPDELAKDAKIALTLKKQPFEQNNGYNIHRIEVIEEPARSCEIISVPKYITIGDTAAVLLEVNNTSKEFRIEAGDGIRIISPDQKPDRKGLLAVQITAEKLNSNIPIKVTFDNTEITGTIQQVISKKNDVYLSSGDEVHIDKTQADYDRFFKWYFANRIGNWYQFRPSYQWSGVRRVSDEFLAKYTGLLCDMHVPYAWQAEGRTLAAHSINPPAQSLMSPMFKGKQAHENDGGYYYWQHFLYEGLYSDLAARARPYGGIFAKHAPIYTNKGTFIHYDPYGVKDMEDGAKKYVANLRYSKGESTRHTGPSTTFRYLYQAGYEWLGAEQMYGPEETILSALRGASHAYGKTEYGTLHAVQWGSYPFTDPKHSDRFYISLALAYMHGAQHINTEEGLWTDEYANDRFSQSGKEHLHAQVQMLDFIETHTRRGSFIRNFGVIQGRNDAWKCFDRGSIWSQKEEKWQFNDAMESFDLLKIFYPENNLDCSGPDGWFTSTPYGPVDLLPIEASEEVIKSYKMLVFLGWNNYREEDFSKLLKFVEQGGCLILTGAHLNMSTNPEENPLIVKRGAFHKIISKIQERNGLFTNIEHGKGKIVYFPKGVYPINKEIRKEYEEQIRSQALSVIESNKAKGWVKHSKKIGFTAWDSADRRTIYLVNIDWKSNTNFAEAEIQIKDRSFNVSVPKYTIGTAHCFDGYVVYPEANTTDVLALKNGKITLQSTGSDQVTIFNTVTGAQQKVMIKSAGVHEISL
ncbi:MAG: hypothetical protein ACRC9Q_01135 [Bacteroidales bacterium]